MLLKRTRRLFNHFLIRTCLLCLIFCAGAGSYTKLHAEPLYYPPDRDSALKLIKIIATAKPDTFQVKRYLSLIEYYTSSEFDSGAYYINIALPLSRQLKYRYGEAMCLCMSAFIQYDHPDSLVSQKLFKEAIAISREIDDGNLEAYILYRMGDTYSLRVNDHEKLDYFTRSRNLYRKVNNKVNEAYMLKCMSDCLFRIGNPVESLKGLLEVIDLYKSAGHKKLHYAYDLTGAVYKSMGNYEEALRYTIAALKSSQETGDTTDIRLFYLRFGTIYHELGQYDNAIPYFMQGLELSKELKICNGKYYTTYSLNTVGEIAEIMGKAGNPQGGLDFYKKYSSGNRVCADPSLKKFDGQYLGEIYMKLGNYPVAEGYLLQWLLTDNSDGRPVNISILLKLGSLYVTAKRYEKAKPYLLQALKSVSVNSSYQLPQIHQLLFCVDSAAGEYLSAIRHYQAYKSITDSIFNEKKINQIASLQVTFDTEKKDRNIMLLTTKTKEQQLILKRQAFQRNAMIVGAAMLLLLLWFIYSRYKVKYKTAKQLEAQQLIINNKNLKLEELLKDKEELLAATNELITEKEWLLKEVHHRVKNNLQMVMTLLYTQSAYLKDEQALNAITESQHRIHAISLIHQKLYQTDNLRLINMKGYIHELVDNLKESFDKEDAIDIMLDIEPLELDVSKSIPIGLMLNEAVTNSLKYAFENGSRKIIAISLRREGDQQYSLTIKDNGKGLPPSFDPQKAKTLGLKLIDGLCKQIKAKYSVLSENGVSIIIHFSNSISIASES